MLTKPQLRHHGKKAQDGCYCHTPSPSAPQDKARRDGLLSWVPGGNRPGAIRLWPSGLTCRLDGHPHLVGTHAARLVQVELPEDGLERGAEGEGQAEGGPQAFRSTPGWGLAEGAGPSPRGPAAGGPGRAQGPPTR